MISMLLNLLRLCPFLCGGHHQLALENLALRHQLVVYKRMVTRPRLHTRDRLFWVWLARVWAGWRQPLVIVTPHRPAVAAPPLPRVLDRALPPAHRGPPVRAELEALVTRRAAANPL